MRADRGESNRPIQVDDIIDTLASMTGVIAITIGGSRATGMADVGSDWDLGVFYRGGIDLSQLERFGDVFPPGRWGRFMNGGAWLRVDDIDIDVLVRDMESVEYWTERASRGLFDVDLLLGYLAGFASYTLVAEIALSTFAFGALEVDTRYPDLLAASGSQQWGFRRDFSLDYALMHARRCNTMGTLGNLARATMEEGHRRMCSNRTWILNEKHLLAATGLGQTITSNVEEGDLVALVEQYRASLLD